MRHSPLTLFWSVAVLALGVGRLFAESAPRYVVIDLGPQMISPVKISDANVVLGHGWHSAWLSWSEGTMRALGRDEIPARPTPMPGLKLPQLNGVNIVPLKKEENVPSLTVRKGAIASTTQVIGNSPDGAYLWEKDNGTDKHFRIPLPLSELVPHDGPGLPWTITSVTDINNGGAMVGTANYTRTSPTDTVSAGLHGVLILPMAIVREDPPGSGAFGPIAHNGLDNESVLPIYATESGAGKSETDKTDDFSAGIYGGLHGPVRSTMIYTFKTRFDKVDTGTLSETAAGSGTFEDRATGVRVALQPMDVPSDISSLNVMVTDPKVNVSGDTHVLRQIAPDSSKYEDTSSAFDIILKAPLSTTATNTLELGAGAALGGGPADVFTETEVNSRIFKSTDGLSFAVTDYKAAPGGSITVKLLDRSLTSTLAQMTLSETSPTSLQYSNYVRVFTDVPVSTPATDGQGIFYIETTGTRPMKVTVASGPTHVTVEAVPVKGRANLLRTGKLVMIVKGDPFRAPGITTIEAAGSEIDLQMQGQTIVK